jgi:hypothetical protein
MHTIAMSLEVTAWQNMAASMKTTTITESIEKIVNIVTASEQWQQGQLTTHNGGS